MPLYEYECDAHHHRFELIRKFSDPPLTTCPTCGSPVHKLFSSPAIQFKGSGFYITDYAKKESTPAGKTEGGKDDGKDSGSKESGAKDKESSGTEKKSGGSEKSDSPAAAPAASADTAPKSPAKSSTD